MNYYSSHALVAVDRSQETCDMTDYDVIIAGAGTGGSIAAQAIAKRGHAVLLIDKKERSEIGHKTCGDALGAHHIKEMQDLIGLPAMPPGIIEHEVNEIDLVAPDRVQRMPMVGPTIKGYSFNRLKLGQWLVSLAENAGVEVLASTRVKKLKLEGGKVSGVTIEGEGSGAEKQLRAKVVIDATGAAGMLRRQLPENSVIEREVAKEDMMVAWRDIYETPDYDFEHPEVLEIFYNQLQTLGGYTWVFPQGRHRVNVGVGLMTLEGHRVPQDVFNTFVRSSWDFMKTKLNAIDSGGGIAPVRRAMDTLVDDHFMLVGDSGCQVNPVHGGGIGSSMLGGAHAGITASEALERNDTSIEALWPYNSRYMNSYGTKQASLDIFRWFLVRVTNDDIDFAFRKGIIKATDLLGVSMMGKMGMGKGEKLKRLASGAGRISLIRRLAKVAKMMDTVKQIYSEYPDSPKGLVPWKARLAPVFDAAKNV
ncbi:MAG: hypothetical protein C4K49_00040 [Candidatus Thorarchaeota archaeon]|nr:MAG: hypothetical protein C4K49_00040 [Candidatus Thorarchaeota archaeon]